MCVFVALYVINKLVYLLNTIQIFSFFKKRVTQMKINLQNFSLIEGKLILFGIPVYYYRFL